MTFLAGYACEAVAPTAVGLLRDPQGTYTLAFTLLVALGLLTLLPVTRLYRTELT